MKTYKSIFVTFFSAIITVFLVYGGYTIYAEDDFYSIFDEGYSFRLDGISFSSAFDRYHDTMNKMFNVKLAKMYGILEDPDFYKKHKDLLYPPLDIDQKKDNLQTIIEKCGENVSTYCVSMLGTDMYLQYLQKMTDLRPTLEQVDEAILPVQHLIAVTAERNERMDQEVERARQALEGTLAVYNEYRLAYPLHKKYEQIIKDLIKYKLALKDLRLETAQFPGKYVDTTSDQCK